jgi:hypothetical protein
MSFNTANNSNGKPPRTRTRTHAHTRNDSICPHVFMCEASRLQLALKIDIILIAASSIRAYFMAENINIYIRDTIEAC